METLDEKNWNFWKYTKRFHSDKFAQSCLLLLASYRYKLEFLGPSYENENEILACHKNSSLYRLQSVAAHVAQIEN